MVKKEELYMIHFENTNARPLFLNNMGTGIKASLHGNMTNRRISSPNLYTSQYFEKQTCNGRVKYLKRFYESVSQNSSCMSLKLDDTTYKLNPNVTKLVRFFEKLIAR